MKGSAESMTYRLTPRPIRRIVASASGRFTPMARASSLVRKIDGQGSDQSIQSAAVRYGAKKRFPVAPCVWGAALLQEPAEFTVLAVPEILGPPMGEQAVEALNTT
jgi:hypothetical protein